MKTYSRKKLILLFSATYFTSYLTRINFGAVISEMVTATGFSMSQLSLALTGSFITYGAGQILSGVLGDKIKPKRLVLYGLAVTVLMNFLIPFCILPWQTIFIWSFNGLAQAFMWPPLVRLMTSLYRNQNYDYCTVRVIRGSSIATVFMYILSPIIISIINWKGIFFFSAICGILMMLIWQKNCPNISPQNKQMPKSKNDVKVFTPIFFVIALAIIICGMLRDGVATWTPSLISDSFNLRNTTGILSGAALPIFGIICNELASKLYQKRFKNPISCAGVVYIIGIMSSIILLISINKSPIFSVISISLLNGAMHGVNLLLICMLPSFYAKSGKVSTVSGILNSFVYIGSAASTYGIAVITEILGWSTTVALWIGLAVLGSIICFSTARAWRKSI